MGWSASLEFAVYFLSHGRWFSFVSVTGRCVGVSWIDHGGGDEGVDLRALSAMTSDVIWLIVLAFLCQRIRVHWFGRSHRDYVCREAR